MAHVHPMRNETPAVLLTFDVEDYFHAENLRRWYPPHTWDTQNLRVEKNIYRILDLLDKTKLSISPETQKISDNSTKPRATFFILGWIAKRRPKMVREIANRGHEIASHGNGHKMCSQLSLRQLKEDLSQSKKILEDITGRKVNGYRAPNFSINPETLNLIKMCGYEYDSSYNNFSRHGRYGTIFPENRTYRKYRLIRPNRRNITAGHDCTDTISNKGAVIQLGNDLQELKISNLTMGNQILPWGGGGYFRFFPPLIFRAGVKRILKKEKTYVFYMHPWEIDPDQPRKAKTTSLVSWRHYLNLSQTYDRLEKMIKTFRRCVFPTCSQFLGLEGSNYPNVQKDTSITRFQ